MAKILVTDKGGKVVKTITCTQDFIDFFDLSFGAFSFEDIYFDKDVTVNNLLKWVKYKVKVWREQKGVNLKWQTRPLEKAENEIIPLLESLNKRYRVVIF